MESLTLKCYSESVSRALIVQTSITDFYSTPHRFSGLGLQSLKGLLLSEYSECVILNFPVMGRKKAPMPEELSYLEPYRIPGESGPLAWFTRYHRFGPSVEQQVEMITAKKPDAVYFSLFAWAYASDMLEVVTELKKINPALPLTLGGSGATVMADYFKQTGLFEEVIEGEAETWFGKEWTKPSVAVKQGRSELIISLMLSRGCPRKCEFCSNHLTFGHTFKTLSPESIIKALAPYKTEKTVRINFEDDNLLFRKEPFFNILKDLKTLFPAACFYAENGLDYSLVNEQDVLKLIELGFRQFNFSLATAVRSTAEKQKRFLNTGLLKNLTDLIDSQGLPSICYFICGLKEDNVNSIRDTFHLFRSLPSLMGISLFYPVPGISGFKDKDHFTSTSPVLCKGASAWPWTGSLTTEEMLGFFRLARLHNFMRNPIENSSGEALKSAIKETGQYHTLVKRNKTTIPLNIHKNLPFWMNKELTNYL